MTTAASIRRTHPRSRLQDAVHASTHETDVHSGGAGGLDRNVHASILQLLSEMRAVRAEIELPMQQSARRGAALRRILLIVYVEHAFVLNLRDASAVHVNHKLGAIAVRIAYVELKQARVAVPVQCRSNART